MKVFLNPGHAPDGNPDPGAVNPYTGLRECDVVKKCTDLIECYLVAAGVDVCGNLQSDDLDEVCAQSNCAEADLFISVHCNAAGSDAANGTETWFHSNSINGRALADCIQTQIIDSLDTTDRGIKAATPGENGLYVLNNTAAVAVLVELAFISNTDDAILLVNNIDDFARAIARGVTDYMQGSTESAAPAEKTEGYKSKYFSDGELMCHGAVKGHCDCGIDTAQKVNPILLQKLDKLREMIGGPVEISCAYRCPSHNDEEGGEVNSQHLYGNAADVQTPDYPHCSTPEQVAWYAEQVGFDGIGIYDWGCHVDVRDDGESPGEYRWDER